jgi:serine phosphatase RsbU (regulator of sigma subunit)
VTFASAGHLPPVLLEPGGAARMFMEGRSPPLGIPVPGEARGQAGFTLEPGGGFLLYTDGLVERRRETIDAGLDRLLATIRASGDVAPDRLVATLPPALLEPDAGGDDVCMLAFRLRG